MKKRILITLMAIAMSMLIAQGALAEDPASGPEVAAPGAQAELDGLLADIEADNVAVVDELVNSLAADEAEASQLQATLDGLSAEKLADVAQNATSVEDVYSMLAEKTFRLGDTSRDFAFTPVTPCRIVNTTVAGGAFFPGQSREFYVYGPGAGPVGMIQQGGNPNGCPSPNGEPRGVHINVTVVPVAGQGNFRAYPANIAPPATSLINYRTGVQNIANAASVQTYFFGGPREIEFLNSFGTAHLIVDVMGYYHATENLAGADFAASSDNEVAVTVSQTVKSVSITAPASGKVIVNASGYARFASSASDGGRCSIRSGALTTIDYSHLIIFNENGNSNTYMPFAATRGFNVGAGTTIFRLNCDRFAGSIAIGDPTITAIWVPRTY